MQLLIWFLIAYGITNILVIGSIFLMMRVNIRKRSTTGSRFYKLLDSILSCMMCCSMWVGFFLGIFIWSPTGHYLEISSAISWFFDGALSSAVVCLIGTFINHYKMQDDNE